MWEHIRGVQVAVPATSANLGPGFDVLGLALTLYNTFTVTPSDSSLIEVEGYGESLPRDTTNLFYQAFLFLCEQASLKSAVLPIHIKMQLEIPPGKGLGSSATAVVGGLVAANELLGRPLDTQELLPFAVQLEHGNHADNVAPALLGGLVVSVYDIAQRKHVALQVPFTNALRAVLFIPDFDMDTVQGRALLPSHYSREDVTYNTGRVALLLSAVQPLGRHDLLRIAMQDKMHQPYRLKAYPVTSTLIRIALEAGALGACLSGGGSSILALALVSSAEEVGQKMLRAARKAGIGGDVRVLDADREGAKATLL